jgi:hypothetical protein
MLYGFELPFKLFSVNAIIFSAPFIITENTNYELMKETGYFL